MSFISLEKNAISLVGFCLPFDYRWDLTRESERSWSGAGSGKERQEEWSEQGWWVDSRAAPWEVGWVFGLNFNFNSWISLSLLVRLIVFCLLYLKIYSTSITALLCLPFDGIRLIELNSFENWYGLTPVWCWLDGVCCGNWGKTWLVTFKGSFDWWCGISNSLFIEIRPLALDFIETVLMQCCLFIF